MFIFVPPCLVNIIILEVKTLAAAARVRKPDFDPLPVEIKKPIRTNKSERCCFQIYLYI